MGTLHCGSDVQRHTGYRPGAAPRLCHPFSIIPSLLPTGYHAFIHPLSKSSIRADSAVAADLCRQRTLQPALSVRRHARVCTRLPRHDYRLPPRLDCGVLRTHLYSGSWLVTGRLAAHLLFRQPVALRPASQRLPFALSRLLSSAVTDHRYKRRRYVVGPTANQLAHVGPRCPWLCR